MDHPPAVAASAVWARARPVLAVSVLALLSLVGGQLPSFSPLATVYVLLLGGGVIWLGVSGRLARRAGPGSAPDATGPAGRDLPAEPEAVAEPDGPAESEVLAGVGEPAGLAAAVGLEVPAGPDAAAGPDVPAGRDAPAGPDAAVGPAAAAGPDLGAGAAAPCGAGAAAPCGAGVSVGAAAAAGGARRPNAAAAWWLAPVLLLTGVELVDLALGSTRPHPTLSVLMDPLLDHHLVRAAGYFCWLTAFIGLARR